MVGLELALFLPRFFLSGVFQSPSMRVVSDADVELLPLDSAVLLGPRDISTSLRPTDLGTEVGFKKLLVVPRLRNSAAMDLVVSSKAYLSPLSCKVRRPSCSVLKPGIYSPRRDINQLHAPKCIESCRRTGAGPPPREGAPNQPHRHPFNRSHHC